MRFSGGFEMIRILFVLACLLAVVPAVHAASFGVPLNLGDRVETGVDPADDTDLYAFEACEGTQLFVSLRPEKGGALVPGLALEDPDGDPIPLGANLTGKKGKLSLKKLILPQTGIYTLIVSSQGGSTGNYELKVTGKPVRSLREKKLMLAAHETRDFRCGAWSETRLKISLKAKGGEGYTIDSVFGPDGGEIAGGIEAFSRKKSSAKATLYAAVGFGDYGLRVKNGSEPASFNVSIRISHSKRRVTRRKLDLSSHEPGITSLDETAGPAGSFVTIRGRNFVDGGTAAFFGAAPAVSTVFVTSTEVRARVPAGAGTVDVSVVNPDGQHDTLSGAFTYAFVTTYTISGAVGGDVAAGVSVSLSGDDSRLTTTTAGGGYVFTGVFDGNYTVTPTLTGYEFSPRNRAVTVAGADRTGIDFTATSTAPVIDTSPPSSTVRLVFIHHSCGSNWLRSTDGGLGDELGDNNYYVRDTNYGWDAPNNTDIGSSTDIGHWYSWFADTAVQGNGVTRRENITGALYTTSASTSGLYSAISNPGGENDIVMFKSCYPNSNIGNDNSTTPSQLFGQSCGSSAHTLSNCKEVYRRLLTFFKTKTDKMFVVVTAPPLVSSSTDSTRAGNARAFNNWLVKDWLSASEGDWEDRNVYVFDFYNVLTDADNHHRVHAGAIQHVATHGNDYSAYGQGGDSHPNKTGNLKATTEFVPLLNAWYHRFAR